MNRQWCEGTPFRASDWLGTNSHWVEAQRHWKMGPEVVGVGLEALVDGTRGHRVRPRGISWSVVFYVPSTVSWVRNGAPIYCPLQRTWSLVFTRFQPGIKPRAVSWQSITLPLRHVSSTREALEDGTRGHWVRPRDIGSWDPRSLDQAQRHW